MRLTQEVSIKIKIKIINFWIQNLIFPGSRIEGLKEHTQQICMDLFSTLNSYFFFTAMTPNELAAVRERYTDEKFPGLDMPMDQVLFLSFL